MRLRGGEKWLCRCIATKQLPSHHDENCASKAIPSETPEAVLLRKFHEVYIERPQSSNKSVGDPRWTFN